MTEETEMTDPELVQSEECDQSAEIESHYYEFAMRAWRADQRVKASVVLESFRRNLPAEVWHEAEELFTSRYGIECFHSLLEREQSRWALVVQHPTANSEEIENFLDNGVWRSKVELANLRAQRAAPDFIPF